MFEKLLSHTFGGFTPKFSVELHIPLTLDENLHHSQVVFPVTPHEIPMDPHAMREPGHATQGQSAALHVDRSWWFPNPESLPLLGRSASQNFSDMGHGFWWVKPATSAKISYRKVVVFACSEYVYIYIYIYNQFSLCMFHVECARCILQLNPATG